MIDRTNDGITNDGKTNDCAPWLSNHDKVNGNHIYLSMHIHKFILLFLPSFGLTSYIFGWVGIMMSDLGLLIACEILDRWDVIIGLSPISSSLKMFFFYRTWSQVTEPSEGKRRGRI